MTIPWPKNSDRAFNSIKSLDVESHLFETKTRDYLLPENYKLSADVIVDQILADKIQWYPDVYLKFPSFESYPLGKARGTMMVS